jgi:hypothetical protein
MIASAGQPRCSRGGCTRVIPCGEPKRCNPGPWHSGVLSQSHTQARTPNAPCPSLNAPCAMGLAQPAHCVARAFCPTANRFAPALGPRRVGPHGHAACVGADTPGSCWGYSACRIPCAVFRAPCPCLVADAFETCTTPCGSTWWEAPSAASVLTVAARAVLALKPCWPPGRLSAF